MSYCLIHQAIFQEICRTCQRIINSTKSFSRRWCLLLWDEVLISLLLKATTIKFGQHEISSIISTYNWVKWAWLTFLINRWCRQLWTRQETDVPVSLLHTAWQQCSKQTLSVCWATELSQRWDLIHSCCRSKDYTANCCNKLPTLAYSECHCGFSIRHILSHMYLHTIVWCPAIKNN